MAAEGEGDEGGGGGGEATTQSSKTGFSDLLRAWEEKHTENGFDPTEIFHQMCEILEKETKVYVASDPDPFEMRHPSRVDITCKLGQHLKSFFKRDNLVKDVFNKYMKDNYFMRQGIDKDSTMMNIAACRLLLDIMPGLELSTMQEQEGLGAQLYRWIEEADEPLKSYATGILAVIMDYHEFASDTEIRERNAKLVPILLRQLKQLQIEGEQERLNEKTSNKALDFKRPFASIAKSPSKRRTSQGSEDPMLNGVLSAVNNGIEDHIKANGDVATTKIVGDVTKDHKKAKMEALESDDGLSLPVIKENVVYNQNNESRSPHKESGIKEASCPSLPGGPLPFRGSWTSGWPAGLQSPSHHSSAGPSAENSNSSWIEMETNIIGHFDIYPITLQTRQVFLLRMLTPLAEYQDFVPMAKESQIISVIRKYLNVKETRDARLGFEACRLLGSLFCHKKYTLEWVYTDGLELLMEMPRPSIAATGSSLCIYYLACDNDTMEKICSLPTLTLERLVKYCLWLLECSHMTGRQYAIMFFGLAVPYLNVLQIFDRLDGLRRLYNSVSTLTMFREDMDLLDLDDDEEHIQRQMIRSSLTTLKAYAEAHLAIRKEKEMSDLYERDGRSPEPGQPSWIPYKPDQAQVTEQIDTLMKVMNYRARWPPIDQFIKLGGVTLLLKIIIKATDWNLSYEDSVKNALDILAICCILPRVQLFLCETLENADDRNTGNLSTGMDTILACSEGEYITDAAVQKASLLVLCHLLCAPVTRPGSISKSASNGSARRKSSEEVINTVWECFRSNNGIMIMLTLIQTKQPVKDADKIRALACQALVGLARSTTATQIMSKLPIFNNGVLTMLVREPVLQDNLAEHQKFQKYAQELLSKVSSGQGSSRNYDASEITLDMLHRASVVANTKIRFNNKQLYQLMHEHLLLSGLKKTAEALRKEADFVPLIPDSIPPVYDTIVSSTTPLPSRRMQMSPPPKVNAPRQLQVTPLSTRMSIQSRVMAQNGDNGGTGAQRSLSMEPSTPTNNRLPSTPSQQPIRIVRTPRNPATNSAVANYRTPKTTGVSGFDQPPGGTGIGGEQEQRRVTLSTLVCDYLSNKHANCKNPMTTCPEFDLFLPHRCPDKRSRREAPVNIYQRVSRRRLIPPFGGRGGGNLDRKLIYSRFRPTKTFRQSAETDRQDSDMFTCCAFSGDGNFIMAGTSAGDMKMWNVVSGTETTYQLHENGVTQIQPSRDNTLVLTSSSWRKPYSKLWSFGEYLEEKYTFVKDDMVEFSKLCQDKVIGTQAEGVATVYDIATQTLVRTLKPRYYNEYQFNKACFDPTDELILCDGVLWDYRMEKEIHKFDKLNQNLSGVFHPSGLEIISNTEVWDIRTFHLQRTVPQLDQCKIVFNNAGNVIFGLQLEQEFDDEQKFETSFRTFDCSDYSSIATIEVKKSVLGLCPNWEDTQIAVVEQAMGSMGMEPVESVVRLYDIGRVRDTEEDIEDGGEEEDGDGSDEDRGDALFTDDDDDEAIIDDDGDEIFNSNSDSDSDDNERAWEVMDTDSAPSHSDSEGDNEGAGEGDNEGAEVGDNEGDNEGGGVEEDENGSNDSVWEDIEVEEVPFEDD